MKYDTVSSTLARIYTTDLNIRGMLKTLERIMDKKSYKNLYERYIILAKDIPKDEILSEGEIKYESFGTDLKYGARPLRRAIQKYIEDEIAELLLRSEVSSGQTVKVDCRKDELKFSVK